MRVALQMGVTALWPKPVNSCDVASGTMRMLILLRGSGLLDSCASWCTKLFNLPASIVAAYCTSTCVHG